MDEDLAEILLPVLVLLAVVGFCLWLASCADQRDMSHREAIDITNLSKELSK